MTSTQGHGKAHTTPSPAPLFENPIPNRLVNITELVLVACHTGLRKGELKALQRHQLDFIRDLVMVDATFSERLRKRFPRTKNGEIGFVPMVAPVRDALLDRTFLPGDAPVFDPSLFADVIGRLRRRALSAGVRPIRFHDLRHSYASTLVMAGVPIYTVQRLMRHKSITMTERYAHLAPDYLREAADKTCVQTVRETPSRALKSLET